MVSKYCASTMMGVIALTSLASAQYETNNFYGNEQSGSCRNDPFQPIYTEFPLYPDGFPYVTEGSDQDKGIAEGAGGIRSNAPLPKSIAKSTVTSIQLAMQYQFYAVAYLTQFLKYITDRKPGFDIKNSDEREYAITQLESQIYQAEQHGLASRNLLLLYGVTPQEPCKYQLLSTQKDDYDSYIFYASLSTEVYLAFAKTSIQKAAKAGDYDLILSFTSIVQNVGERLGVLRRLGGLKPSANPFPNSMTEECGLSYLINGLIVPGSCPNLDLIDLGYFAPLDALERPYPCGDVDQIVRYSIRNTGIQSLNGYYIYYSNQQNSPLVLPIENVQNEGGCITFDALFPCSLLTFGQGMTTVALVNNSGPFYSNDAALPYVTHGIWAFYLS